MKLCKTLLNCIFQWALYGLVFFKSHTANIKMKEIIVNTFHNKPNITYFSS